MKNLIKIISLIVLIILINACSVKNNFNKVIKPSINDSVEVIDASSIRTISDVNSIAFEWQKVDDVRVIGYNLYRANMYEDGTKLKFIKMIQNRYTTHYVDKNLHANTKYIYKISSNIKGDEESRATNAYIVSTLDQIDGISFVQAISNLPRQIKIIWRPHTNERILSYEIQRTSTHTSQWNTLAVVRNRLQAEYIDLDLEDNVIYSYRVIANTFDDLQTKPSDIVKAQTKAIPLGIQGTIASTNLARKINISWNKPHSSPVVQYNLYRNQSSKNSFSLLKTFNSNTLSFDDFINEDGKIYFYKVSYIDNDGLESDLNMNSVMGVTLNKLNKPIITLAQIQGEKAILNWMPADNRAVSYIIHKTIKKDFLSTKKVIFNNIQELRFEDRDIIRGVEYKYSIQAVDKFGIISNITKQTELILPELEKIN